jgi:superfamily II DNA/RNA helicase
MFDMGFLRDVRKILAHLPARRQNLLFSATMPKEIRRLADELLRNPEVVELVDSAPAATNDHALYSVSEGRKRDLWQDATRRHNGIWEHIQGTGAYIEGA